MTHAAPPIPMPLAKAVRAHRADLGISLDGDGDRLMMADATGRIYDGDSWFMSSRAIASRAAT
jgi:phosphomannomutase